MKFTRNISICSVRSSMGLYANRYVVSGNDSDEHGAVNHQGFNGAIVHAMVARKINTKNQCAVRDGTEAN
jgi:hypothetical protein